MQDLIKKMFEAGVHYGYSKASRHPSAQNYVFGNKDGVEIIDLEKTSQLLEEAKEFVSKLATQKKQLLFVSSKPEAREAIRDAAERIDQPYISGRWVGGIFTNFDQIKRRLSKLEDLKRKREKGELAKYTKKEQLLISREIEDLEARFGGIADMRELPGAIFVIDPKHERIAVAEANKRNIPVVSLMNTDCDSSYVDYPIYGNDAARPSIAFFVEEIASAYRDTAKKS